MASPKLPLNSRAPLFISLGWYLAVVEVGSKTCRLLRSREDTLTHLFLVAIVNWLIRHKRRVIFGCVYQSCFCYSRTNGQFNSSQFVTPGSCKWPYSPSPCYTSGYAWEKQHTISPVIAFPLGSPYVCRTSARTSRETSNYAIKTGVPAPGGRRGRIIVLRVVSAGWILTTIAHGYFLRPFLCRTVGLSGVMKS